MGEGQPDQDTPGSRLRRARRKLNKSAGDLARLAGVSASAVRNQENGTNGIPAKAAEAYAAALGVTPQWILFGEGSGKSFDSLDVARRMASMSPIQMTALPNGRARLELSVTLPYSTALQILALVNGDEK